MLARYIRGPKLRKRASAGGLTGTSSSARALAGYIETESANWSKIVRDGGIKRN